MHALHVSTFFPLYLFVCCLLLLHVINKMQERNKINNGERIERKVLPIQIAKTIMQQHKRINTFDLTKINWNTLTKLHDCGFFLFHFNLISVGLYVPSTFSFKNIQKYIAKALHEFEQTESYIKKCMRKQKWKRESFDSS